VFENRVLRRIFGPKREEEVGGRRRLKNEELHNLYTSLNNIRMIRSRRRRWAGHVALMGGRRNAYSILVGKPEGKRPLVRFWCGWETNIRMDLRETGREVEDWMHLVRIGTNGGLL
jgi:hypothetical protein